MKWDAVLVALTDVVTQDTALVAVYGDAMRMAGTDTHRVPVLEWFLVADGEDELWDNITVQLDQWTATAADLWASERRLRQLFHQELPASMGGMSMWMQYQDGAALTVPDRDGYFGRAIRFKFTPLRELYEPSPTTQGS